MPHLYPVFLDLHTLSALIVGFGSVGQRKLAMLVPCAPRSVRILDTAPPAAEGQALLERARSVCACTFESRTFDEEDLAGTSLVFTCTGDRALNARIADLCARARILCNCTDNPPAGTFHVPAVARSGHLAAALSTEGASPALSRRWKEELTAWLAPRDRMAALMGALRPRILALNLPTPDNTALFRSLSSGALEEALARQDMPRALALLQELLPKALHPDLPDVLNSLNL